MLAMFFVWSQIRKRKRAPHWGRRSKRTGSQCSPSSASCCSYQTLLCTPSSPQAPPTRRPTPSQPSEPSSSRSLLANLSCLTYCPLPGSFLPSTLFTYKRDGPPWSLLISKCRDFERKNSSQESLPWESSLRELLLLVRVITCNQREIHLPGLLSNLSNLLKPVTPSPPLQ